MTTDSKQLVEIAVLQEKQAENSRKLDSLDSKVTTMEVRQEVRHSELMKTIEQKFEDFGKTKADKWTENAWKFVIVSVAAILIAAGMASIMKKDTPTTSLAPTPTPSVIAPSTSGGANVAPGPSQSVTGVSQKTPNPTPAPSTPIIPTFVPLIGGLI